MSTKSSFQYISYCSSDIGVVKGCRHVLLYQPKSSEPLSQHPSVSEVNAITQGALTANVPYSVISQIHVNNILFWWNQIVFPLRSGQEAISNKSADRGIIRLELLVGVGETAIVRAHCTPKLGSLGFSRC